MMNINLNGMLIQKIQEICKEHSECRNCPVLEQYGLHENDSVIYCSKVEQKMREQQNGNS